MSTLTQVRLLLLGLRRYLPRGLSLVRLGVPVAIILFAIGFYHSSRALPFMAAGYPRFLIMVLIPVALIVLLREAIALWRERQLVRQHHQRSGQSEAAVSGETLSARSVDEDREDDIRLLPFALACLWLVVLVVAVREVGIRWAVTILPPVLLMMLGYFNWKWIVLVTIGLVAIVELIFVRLFQVPLPGTW